jgi:hypothetical protein
MKQRDQDKTCRIPWLIKIFDHNHPAKIAYKKPPYTYHGAVTRPEFYELHVDASPYLVAD